MNALLLTLALFLLFPTIIAVSAATIFYRDSKEWEQSYEVVFSLLKTQRETSNKLRKQLSSITEEFEACKNELDRMRMDYSKVCGERNIAASQFLNAVGKSPDDYDKLLRHYQRKQKLLADIQGLLKVHYTTDVLLDLSFWPPLRDNKND